MPVVSPVSLVSVSVPIMIAVAIVLVTLVTSMFRVADRVSDAAGQAKQHNGQCDE